MLYIYKCIDVHVACYICTTLSHITQMHIVYIYIYTYHVSSDTYNPAHACNMCLYKLVKFQPLCQNNNVLGVLS